MKKITTVYIKLYYRLLRIIVPVKRIYLPASISGTRNIFLYFDYEREFGGHNVKVNDNDILGILDILENASIKTTWFTVGKIFGLYPESVRAIISGGHELASHTFNHRPPLQTGRSKLKKDFKEVRLTAPGMISGFHSPNGQWSLTALRLLKLNGYLYDLVHISKVKTFIPFRQHLFFSGKIIRIHTTGDDWPLYGKNFETEEVLGYFKKLYEKIGVGELAGIGFHPWILLSDERIMKGFISFIQFLREQPDVKTGTALEFVKFLEA